MMRHPACIAMDALLEGQEVQINEYIYVLSEDEKLCIKTDKPDILLIADMPIGAFIKECKKMPEHQQILMTANLSLYRLTRRKHEKKEAKLAERRAKAKATIAGKIEQG